MAILDSVKIRSIYEESVNILSSSDVMLDRNKRAELQKRVALLQELLDFLQKIEVLEKDQSAYNSEIALIEAKGDDADLDYLQMVKEEVSNISANLKEIQKELEAFLYPADNTDKKSCFVEIRAGAGGMEASLFASELAKMYSNYALTRNWEASLSSVSETDLGGVRELIMFIKGKNAYGCLKFESGVHRVQRVPQTEAAGRIHTSTVTVAVLPEADEVDVHIAQSDLRVDVYRSSGAGGQHVNTTDSAVRITHIPTGIVVTCQDERSQIKNRVKALKELRARILAQETKKAEEARSKERNSQIGSGDRSEKIRTYNFPQNRVTDHRIDFSLKKLDMVMAGDLSDLLEAIQEESKKDRKILPDLAFLFEKN